MTAGRARLPGSGAYMWAPATGCLASVAMQEQFPPEVDSEKRREGTAAHWYAMELLQGRDVAAGAVAPNGVPVSAEMVDCAQSLLLDVRDTLAAPQNADLELLVEQLVPVPSVHPENWVRLEVVAIDRPGRRLFLWEYKFGHRFVGARENWQLLNSTIAAFDYLQIPPENWTGWRVHFAVVQPRNYDKLGPVREWYISGEGVRDRLAQFRKAAFEALAPGATMRTGENCRDCSARHACRALQESAMISLDVALDSTPVDLPPAAVGLELRLIRDAIARLEARQSGLEAVALAAVRAGNRIPFMAGEHAVGRERWNVPAAEVFALGDALDVNLRKEPDPITPNQARAAMAKLGFDGAVIAAYAEKPRGALRLVYVDDADAALAFN